MVCAPSNKAVSVLCTRFLDSLRSFEELPCNIVLVGDDDKLLDDEQSRIKDGQHRSRLRSIFLYTWIRTVLDHLLILQKFVKRPKFDKREIKRIKKQAISLSNRLRQSLSRFPEDIGTALDRLIHLLEIGITKGGVSQREALDIIDALQKEIEGWKSDLIWQDLLGSAHIIFCTLASAGAGILKKSVGQRKFEACTNKNTAVVPFLLPLLGGKKPTHIKFSESAKGEIVPHEVNNEEYLEVSLFSDEEMETFFHAPRLNPIQEKAALTFLNSQPNTITLIQG